MVERRSFDLPGWTHGVPVPLGCRVGNMVFSSRIGGRDAARNHPADPTEQAKLLFRNLTDFMVEAGGTLENIGTMTVLMAAPQFRPVFEQEWLAAFPDPASRPARYVQEGPIGEGIYFQLIIIAVL